MTRSSRIKSATLTKKQSPRSVMKSSNGSMPTNWLRLTSLQTSKKKWKAFAIPSSLSYTKQQEEHQVVCPVVCQEEQEVPQVLVVQEDQPSKKSIKQTNILNCLCYLSIAMYTNSHSTNYLIAC